MYAWLRLLLSLLLLGVATATLLLVSYRLQCLLSNVMDTRSTDARSCCPTAPHAIQFNIGCSRLPLSIEAIEEAADSLLQASLHCSLDDFSALSTAATVDGGGSEPTSLKIDAHMGMHMCDDQQRAVWLLLQRHTHLIDVALFLVTKPSSSSHSSSASMLSPRLLTAVLVLLAYALVPIHNVSTLKQVYALLLRVHQHIVTYTSSPSLTQPPQQEQKEKEHPSVALMCDICDIVDPHSVSAHTRLMSEATQIELNGHYCAR